MSGIETLVGKPMEKFDLPYNDELLEMKEISNNIEDGNETRIESPDISYIERVSRLALRLQCSLKVSEIESFNYYTSYEDRMKHTPKEDSELGSWVGGRGESKFVPSGENEAGVAAREKLFEYGKNGVEYKFAEPNFSECCESEVKIDNMTENRENYIDENGEYQQGNFAQADAKCAECWNEAMRDGKDDWMAADVREWRRENHYSWHECCDTYTMQLVSRDIHSVFKHSGGVAECKVRDNVTVGGEFDE